MKFIHVTDTHLVPAGQLLFGLDPIQRLNACIDDINTHHGDAGMCIITGDIADRGEPEAYADMNRCLARLSLPWHVLVGNHDHRDRFKQAFPQAPTDENGFVQSALETEAGVFLCLDTIEPGTSKGSYCGHRRRWLRRRLAEYRGRSIYLFMHHPPFDIGIPSLDRVGLREKEEFARAVDGFDTIRHIFFGHVHRPVAGSWRGIPFTTMRGTNHQVPFDLETVKPVPHSHEPPAYAVVFLDDRQTTVHFHDYLDKTTLDESGGAYTYAG